MGEVRLFHEAHHTGFFLVDKGFFLQGQAKEKLSKFLVYFQRYMLTKQFIPLHVEFSILDTFDNLEELARLYTAFSVHVVFEYLCGC